MTESIARLRIELWDTEPIIWRCVEFPVSGHLKMLHQTIQAAMGWWDSHLWEFRIGERRYGETEPDWPVEGLAQAKHVRLQALIDRGTVEFQYDYDFGDNWHLTVKIEAVYDGAADQIYPRYIDGEWHAPPEDVGGTPGFEAFLEAVSDSKNPEHAEASEWFMESHGYAFAREFIDLDGIELGLEKIRRRRAGGKAFRDNLKAASTIETRP